MPLQASASPWTGVCVCVCVVWHNTAPYGALPRCLVRSRLMAASHVSQSLRYANISRTNCACAPVPIAPPHRHIRLNSATHKSHRAPRAVACSHSGAINMRASVHLEHVFNRTVISGAAPFILSAYIIKARRAETHAAIAVAALAAAATAVVVVVNLVHARVKR